MNQWTETFAPLIGRILLGGFFLWNGIQAILNLTTTIQIFIKVGLPNPSLWAVVALAVEVLGGMALVVGYKSKLSALLLIFYTLISSALLLSTSTSAQLQLFLGNMGVIGGLLYVAAYGSGRFSTDK